MGYLGILRIVLTRKSLLLLFVIFLLYLSISISIMNHSLVFETIFGNYSLIYKFSIISSLFLGLYTGLSVLDFYLLLVTAFFVGLNFTLFFLTLNSLKKSQLGFVVGGASLLSITAAGCTSCGLSILSILGFSSALVFLPFDGLTIHFISLPLLLFSTFYMLKNLNLVCKIPPK